MKKLGYTMAHIWACPPSEGDDYIFHCHPTDQKIPKPKRLQEWYKKMLDKGIIERIVLDYKDIYKQALEDNIQSPAELPYFEGDFWPNVMEENIRELEQEEEQRKRELEEAERLQAAADAEEEEPDAVGGTDSKKINQKKQKKKKSLAQRKANQKKPQAESKDLTSKVFATMEKHKEVFFTIRLHSAQSAASLSQIQDPDPTMQVTGEKVDLMDGRDAFLTMARDRHLEFSSLRRCKYSSLAMLYELHTQAMGQDKFVYNCNTCSKSVETRYHCTVCEHFDLCVCCYQKDGHPHKMEKLGFDLGDPGGDTPATSNPQEARKLSIQRCIQSLVHACQCRDANCRLPSCHKMKRVVSHTKQCKRKSNGGCPICKQLIALCCYHAKMCQEAKCPVPFCQSIKQKLKQQQLQQRLQEAAMMRRRIAQMNSRMNIGNTGPEPAQKPVGPIGGTHNTGGTSSNPGQSSAITAAAPSIIPQQTIQVSTNAGGINAMGPGTQMRPVLMNNHPSSTGMTGKPGPQSGPSDAVLHAVKKVQEEAQRQSNQQSPGQTRFVTPVQMNQGNNMGQMVSGQQITPSGTINNTLPQGGTMNSVQQQGTNTIMVQQNQGNWSQPSRFSGPGCHITNQSPQPGMQARMGAPQMQQGGQQPK